MIPARPRRDVLVQIDHRNDGVMKWQEER